MQSNSRTSSSQYCQGDDSFITRHFVVQGPNMLVNLSTISLAAALTMQTAPNKRFFPQFLTTKRSAANARDVDELNLVKLVEADDSPGPLQDAHPSSAIRAVPSAQAFVNRLLVSVNEAAQKNHIRLISGLTSHFLCRGAAMHANDGALSENWIIERGGWQLDRVNQAFGYMLGTTHAVQRVARILSGWSPKQGALLPSLPALDVAELQIRSTSTLMQHALMDTFGWATLPIHNIFDSTSSGTVVSRTGPVRDPWMRTPSEIHTRFGSTAPPSRYALYSSSGFIDDDVTKELDFDPATDQRRDYYIGLFHELRWYGNKKTSRRSRVPEWQALCQRWGAFVENFNKNPAGYRERVPLARERYERFSKRPKIDRLHWGAVEAGIPCAVPMGIAC
ncbi:unnamed protein product [Phytophthora fragariaefolia]|uniref:Unnamed protein product n=1 Tax=Phytophthora fragariaefolia TaxID=1490495 RepID=A0A9W6XVL3_9STRA|nr:unnamed protein product [Phytophthora fragariaefolia]